MIKKIKVLLKLVIFVLSILLFIVCFHIGKTYSTFVYDSSSQRAVEMIIKELDYNIKINNEITSNYKINPGNNVLNIEIESLNDTDTYFKLLSSSNELDYYYIDDYDNKIKQKDVQKIKLFVSNKTNEIVDCRFIVSGGYINNKVEDIIIPDGYYEISNSINKLDNVIFNNKEFKILDILEDGSINIILSDAYDTNEKISGSLGYKNAISEINKLANNIFNGENVVSVRNVSIEDIENYTNNKIVSFENKTYSKFDEFYIPISNSNDITYTKTNDINISETILNNDFNDSVLNSLFLNNNYSLLNTCIYIKEDVINWGVLGVEKGKVIHMNLYNSNNINNELNIIIKPIIKVSNRAKINLDVEHDYIYIE